MTRPKSELLDLTRTAMALGAGSTDYQMGTKGDVQAFFLALHQLIKNGKLKDEYPTITHDLYRACIAEENCDVFFTQVQKLREALAQISPKAVDWDELPNNKVMGEKSWEKQLFDLSKPNLAEVFEYYFHVFDHYFEVIEYGRENNTKILGVQLFVIPANLLTQQKYHKLSFADFMAQADDPMWWHEAE